MANAIVNFGKGVLLNGDVDFVNHDIKLMLITSSHTPDIDAEEYIDDVSANEVSGAGYTAGGKSTAGKVVVVDDTNNRAYFDADDVAWTTATITARYAYLYRNTGVASTSPIIGYYDYATNQACTGGTFTHSFTAPASGGALYLS